MKCPVEFKVLSHKDRDSFPKGNLSGVKEGIQEFIPIRERRDYPATFTEKKQNEKVTFQEVRQDLSKAEAFVAQLTVEEMARLAVCASAGWGMEGIGEAGREAVLPLENNLDYLDKFADKIAERIPAAQTGPVYLQIDGKTFATLYRPYGIAEDRRVGTSFT